MSRSGYCDDGDFDTYYLYRSSVYKATVGLRGQEFFHGLLSAIDAMPVKELIAGELETKSGAVCAIGSLGKALGKNMAEIDADDRYEVAKMFNIAPSLAADVVYMNDEYGGRNEPPADRWTRMRAWVASQILPPPTSNP